ncbi:hypothetical protein Glove_315g56 [Diversispora epigaea]|uniref:Uncharacterized protein n=1 Tax=Diversispora epigaea TaxID=1348612 RepID=A0A397HW79_9GLOM|nr:hypothetical protein Glove_315g56 [Diversispora epigaea]
MSKISSLKDFPVDMLSAPKHELESMNLISPQENKKVMSVEEGITQENMLNSVTETFNIFREIEFPGYCNKSKKYEIEFGRQEQIYKYEYMTLFDKIIEDLMMMTQITSIRYFSCEHTISMKMGCGII